MPLTEQQMFNKVWQHFIVEGNPPCFIYSPGGMLKCRYRKQGEKGCAIGVNLPDTYYYREMENKSIMAVCEGYPRVKEILGDNLPFLMRLQYTHDRAADVATDKRKNYMKLFELDLRALAKDYHLEVPSSDQPGSV